MPSTGAPGDAVADAIVFLFDGNGVTRVDDGVRAKETAHHWVEIYRQAYNWRVVTSSKATDGMTYDRYWCYRGVGFETLELAVLACLAWDGAEDTEPAWWYKSGQTGEYRESEYWFPTGGAAPLSAAGPLKPPPSTVA